MLPSTLLTTAHPEVRACLSAWIRDPVERPNAVWCGLVSNISMNEWFNLTLWTLKYATCAGCWKFWVNSNGACKCEEQEMATLVLLPGEFHEQRSLVGFSRKELDTLGLQGNQTRQSLRILLLHIHWKDWCWSWNFNFLAALCEELTNWRSPWCWETLKAGGEADNRGWDGGVDPPAPWIWV